ncbi:MAG TPA: DMT family transporter [Ferrovibrio sp.]|uniref:DMT family transporter n=1 Tax=Ferrovibrio sp. TaxID=1917215 RepID=UPI002ED4E673
MQKKHSLDGMAILLMTALCLTWGIQQVVIKVAAEDVSPLLQAGIRSVGATILVLAWMRWRGLKLLQGDGSLIPGIFAGLLFGAEFGLIFVGLTLTTASRAVILLYTTPFWVALGSHVFIPGERIRPVQVAGLLLAFGGVVLTFAERVQAPQPRELLGDALMVMAAILWAATTILIKASRLRSVSPHKTLLYQLAVSGVGLILAAILSGEPFRVPATPFVIGALGFQIVIVASISYVVWFWLIQRYPVSRLSAFSFLTPVFGVASGAFYLDEPLSFSLLLALLLVAVGIYIVNMPKNSATQPNE